MPQLETSPFDSLPVIVFRNKSTGSVDALVCDNGMTASREVGQMLEKSHIEILAVTNAAVKRTS